METQISTTKKPLRKIPKRIWIPVLLILLCPLTWWGVLKISAIISCNTINRTKRFHEEVNIQPLVNLSVPQDMDLSKLTAPNLYSSSLWNDEKGGYDEGIMIRVERCPSVECAQETIEGPLYCGLRDIETQAGIRYCISGVSEYRSSMGYHIYEILEINFCSFQGLYISEVSLQKDDIFISMVLHSKTLENNRKDIEIQRIADEILNSVENGNYPRTDRGEVLFSYYCMKCHQDKTIPYAELSYDEMRNIALSTYSVDGNIDPDKLIPVFAPDHVYRVYPCPHKESDGTSRMDLNIEKHDFIEILKFIQNNPDL